MQKFKIWSFEEEGYLRPGPVEHRNYTSYQELGADFTVEQATEICIEKNGTLESAMKPDFVIVPIYEEYDDGQGRKYDITDEELR